jgi:hypothetical protein
MKRKTAQVPKEYPTVTPYFRMTQLPNLVSAALVEHLAHPVDKGSRCIGLGEKCDVRIQDAIMCNGLV